MSSTELLTDGALSVPEGAEFSGLSRSTLYQLMERRELAYAKVGKRRLIPKRALIELMERGLVTSEATN